MVLLHLVWLSVKESTCQCKTAGLIPGWGRTPGIGNGNPLQYFLPGEFHGQRSLAGYCLWDHKRAGHDWVTEQLTPLHRRICLEFNSNYVVWYLLTCSMRSHPKRAPQAKKSVGNTVNCVSLVVSWCTWAFWKTWEEESRSYLTFNIELSYL